MVTGLNKDKIALQFEKHHKLSSRGLAAQYDNTRMCQAFYAGDIMNYQDKVAFVDNTGKRRRAMVNFNRVRPNVDAVNGFMMQMRRKAKYVARIPNNATSTLYSRYMNALADYIRENCNADQVESQQNNDMLVNGYGVTATDISYINGNATKDPNGEIIEIRVDPLCAGWDATAKQKNATDRRWNYWWDDYDLKDALDLFEGSKEDDFEPALNDSATGDYQYNPYGGRYDKIRAQDSVEWADKQEDRVRVYSYEWFEYENYYRAENPIYTINNPQVVQRMLMEMEMIANEVEQGDDMFTFDPRAKILTFNDEIKRKLVAAFGKYIKIYQFKRKAFYTAILSGKHVFTAFRSISQQDFAMQLKTGAYDAAKRIWIGMVNSMAEPAKYYNKALTEFMFTIATNSKGGVMIERGAVEDVADFEKKWAKTDAAIVVEDGALSGEKIREKARPLAPSGLTELITLTDSAIATCSGIDASFLGSKEFGQESGILYKRRIRQVTAVIAPYFDSETLFQKIQARILLDFIRIYVENNDGSMFRLVGEDGKDQLAMIASDKMAAEYDVVVEEAALTPEDKEETAETITTVAQNLLGAGDVATAKALFAEGFQLINMDADVKQRVIAALQPQQQQIDPAEVEQLKQQLQILSSETNMADVQLKISQAELNKQKLAEVSANVKLKGSQTAKALEEAQKTDVETARLRQEPINNNNM